MDGMFHETPAKKSRKQSFGSGKRSVKNRSRKAAQARWQRSQCEENIGETVTVAEHSLEPRGEHITTDQLQTEEEEQNVPCAARRKLSLIKQYVEEPADRTSAEKQRCFMELTALQSLFLSVSCGECGARGSLHVSYGDKMGYSRQIKLECKECVFNQQQYSCTRRDGSDKANIGFDINDSMMVAFNELGCGQAAMKKFSALLGIPGMANRTYRRLSRKIGRAHREVAENVLSAAVEAVRNSYSFGTANHSDSDGSDVDDAGNDYGSDCANSDRGDYVPGDGDVADTLSNTNDSDVDDDVQDELEAGSDSNNDRPTTHCSNDLDSYSGYDKNDRQNVDVVDVMVSFDGTWHKRGYTSNYGVGIVIDVTTGLVLDYEVLSKYCQACATAEKRQMTDLERNEWLQTHRMHCEKNYEGSSKGMEKEAALRLWGRSITKNNMRYTSMLSDGDSVAYKAVCDANFYPVRKLECLNHCDKRMGTALRKKAKEEKLGGRRYGSLTASACSTLQSYYRNAIQKHLGNPEKMREAIWATYLHCSSTDANPQHEQCPEGTTSWCFYNRAVAEGKEPGRHKENVGTPLSEDVAKAVKHIYERMSDTALLSRIQHGRTQNANECVNGQIWARCPKTVHVGASRINAAVASAISHFNQGCAHLKQVMHKLDAATADDLQMYQAKQDQKRCTQAETDSEPAMKTFRKNKKQQKKSKKLTQERAEGPTYGPGML